MNFLPCDYLIFISSNLEQTKCREIWNGKNITQQRKVLVEFDGKSNL